MLPRRPFPPAFAAPLSLASCLLACSSSGESTADAGRDAPSDGTLTADVRDARAPDAGGDAHGHADAGAPSLLDLRVEAKLDASPGLTLTPAFAPDVYDYYVRCPTPVTSVEVTLTAPSGTTCALTAPITAPPAPSQKLTFAVKANQAIVATATRGSQSTEYWVRCLPSDFPLLDMQAHSGAGVPSPGYYLVGNAIPLPGQQGYAIALDARGVPVWYEQVKTAVTDLENLEPGTMSFNASPWEIHQLSPLMAPQYLPPTQEGQHELRVLPNGDYLLTTAPLVTGVNLTGFTVGQPDGGSEVLGANASMVDCNLVEFSPAGKIVWTWVGSKHLDPFKSSTWRVRAAGTFPPDAGVVADPYHCNSIDVEPSTGNLLVSARDMDAVFLVERSTGRILWKMGGLPTTLDDSAYVPVADPFYRQHDARLAPDWTPTCAGASGHLSMFDDETSVTSGRARGVLYDVRVAYGDAGAGADCGASTDAGTPGASVSWQHAAKVDSAGMGSFRTLPDGSRTIGWGGLKGSNAAFTEVDDAGRALLDFSFPGGEKTYRAVKIPITAFPIGVLRSTTGPP